MAELNKMTVLITGASSGIGEATARMLSAGGACVVLGARRTDRLKSVVEDLRGSGRKCPLFVRGAVIQIDWRRLRQTRAELRRGREAFTRPTCCAHEGRRDPAGSRRAL